MRQSDRRVARRLPLAGERHAFGDLAASFGRRRQDEIGRGHRRHLDVQVDAVDQRAGNAPLVVGGAAGIGGAAAGIAGVVGVAAAAGIHRRHQHEARRVSDPMIGARDRDLAGLQRLPQRVERLRREFRQFVEKQHAVMGKRDFSRPRMDAAADQSRHAGGMMRRPERPPVVSAPHHAGDRGHHGDFRSSAGASGGRMDGSRAASIDLPAPGGPTRSRLWPPAAATSSARLALSWPLMSARSRRRRLRGFSAAAATAPACL